MTEFKDIAGFEHLYKVSSSGYIVSLPIKIGRNSGFFIRGEKILKPQLSPQGTGLEVKNKNVLEVKNAIKILSQ